MSETPIGYATRAGDRHRDRSPALLVASSVFLLLALAMLLITDLHNHVQWFLVIPWAAAGLACLAMLLEARGSRLDARSAGGRATVAPLLLFVVGLGLGGLDLAGTVFGQDPHVRARAYKCQSNLREIWMGVTMFTAANGGRMPQRLEDLVTSPAVGLGREALACPAGDAAPGAAPGAPSYVYAGAALAAPLPPAAVIAYEPVSRHGDDVHVLFGSGTVRSLPERQARRLIAELNAGHNPPRNP